MDSIVFPAEWHPQSFVQLTWPHENTDWAYCIDEAYECFSRIAAEISKRQKLLIVCRSKTEVLPMLAGAVADNVYFAEMPTNDTWARDHAGITVYRNGSPVVYDFSFNGWGLKFPANHDNLITRNLFADSVIGSAERVHQGHFVFEGGSIESNGKGVLLTTSECLLSCNRNEHFNEAEIEAFLKDWFGATHVHWLRNGYLAGDDTDSHIDTLARFVAEDTIMYVQCADSEDEHYSQLQKMEEELVQLRQPNGQGYKLIPLPMVPEIFDKEQNERLPATYANFLIINDAVLVPLYNAVTDHKALDIFKEYFHGREIVGIDCSVLIRQHGSLHCVSMQFPEGIRLAEACTLS